MANIEITNKALFEEKVSDVELDFRHKGGNEGDITIEFKEDIEAKVVTGEFGKFDYEEDYGFVIIF